MSRRFALLPWIVITVGLLFVVSEASAQGRVLGYGRAFGRGDYGGGVYGTRTYVSGLSSDGATWGYFPGLPYGRNGYANPAAYSGLRYAPGTSGFGNYGRYVYGYSQLASGTFYATGPNITPLPAPTFEARPVTYVAPASSVVVTSPPLSSPPPPSPSASADPIRLKLAASANGSVSYDLNGTSYVMAPGYSQKFDADRNWTITYDDGTGDRQSQTLSAGSYEFTRHAGGRWELRKQ